MMESIGVLDIGKWMKAIDVLASMFSTCARRTYAAVIVDKNGNLYSFGYNGVLPDKAICREGGCPRGFSNSQPGIDYSNCLAPHAEMMAILNAGDIKPESTMIINAPPCESCGRLISHSGLSRVVYKPNNDYSRWSDIKTQIESHGVKVLAYVHASAEEKAPEATTIGQDMLSKEKVHK